MATLTAVKPNSEQEENQLLTVEEFFECVSSDRCELIDGKIFPMAPVGESHSDIAAELIYLLKQFVRQQDIGRIYSELSCILGEAPGVVRVPDVAFVENARLSARRDKSRFFQGAPTLAIEIISPSERWPDVEEKVRLYLQSGTKVVWLVEPEAKVLTVRTTGKSQIYYEDDTLLGGDILPGFTLPLRELFQD